MKNELAARFVPMIEAARMIVRLDQGGRFHSNREVTFALLEAARTGRVVARGIRYATGKPAKISRRDWQRCHADWGRFVLYEPGTRLPRFTDVESMVTREFGPREAEPSAAGGKKKAAVVAAIEALTPAFLAKLLQKEREAKIKEKVHDAYGLSVSDRLIRNVWRGR